MSIPSVWMERGPSRPTFHPHKNRFFLHRFPVAIRNRQPSIAPECTRGDLDTRRSLAALVLAEVYEACDALHGGRIEAHGNKLVDAAILLNVGTQDGIEHLIRRQAVGVLLVGAQLSGGWLVNDRLWDDRFGADRVAIDAEFIDNGLEDILDHCEAASHVAIERTVAHGHLGFVTCGQDKWAKPVRNGHNDIATNARLEVFRGQAGIFLADGRNHCPQRSTEDLFNWNGQALDAQVLGQFPRVCFATFGRIARGHGDAEHILRAQRVNGYGRDQRGVDASGEGNQRLLKTRLAHVVPGSQDQRGIDLLQAAHYWLDALGSAEHDGSRVLQHSWRQHGLAADLIERHIVRVDLEALFATAWIVQARAEGSNRVQIHDQHILLELFRARDQRTLGVEDHAATVMHDFVLPANQVEIGHDHAIVSGARRQHLLAEVLLPGRERRAIDIQDHLGPRVRLNGNRTGRIPDILANVYAHEIGRA